MEDLLTYKAKSFGYAEVGEQNPNYTYLEGVLEGLTISQDTPEETPINGEFFDQPLETIDTQGSYVIEFDLGMYNPQQIQDLEGGVFNPATGTYDMPTSVVKINKQCRLDFYYGLEHILIHKGKITTNWDGSDLKTTPYKLHVRIVALIHNGKTVTKKFQPEGVTIGAATVADIADTTAKVNYSVSLSAGKTITEKGVCYAKHKNPVVNDAKSVSTGTSAGASEATLTGLTAETEYHVRPYVIYEGNVVYGNEAIFNTTATA